MAKRGKVRKAAAFTLKAARTTSKARKRITKPVKPFRFHV